MTTHPTPPRTASLPDHLACALLAALALGAVLFQLYVGLERHPERSVWIELWRMARYFTILTTGLAAGVFAFWTLRPPRGSGLAGGITLWCVIVGLVYHALLARDFSGMRFWADHGLHTVVPLAILIWWLTLAPKAGLAARHAVLWLIWPGLYLAYALIRGEIDGRHPYFFVDPPMIGWLEVCLWIAGLAAAFWAMGRALVALGRWLSPDRPHPEDGAPAGPRPR